MTASGQVVGTVAYMAPEVIRGEEPTAAADLYALGCVLFECLTGEVPYPGPSAATRHLRPPRAAAAAHPGAARRFDAVIARALAKDPAKRFGSGAELVAAARRRARLEARAPPARPEARCSPRGPPSPGRRRRRRSSLWPDGQPRHRGHPRPTRPR